MKKLLLIIDVQNAFINKKTKHILKRINSLLDSNTYDDVIFTRFINSKDSLWYKKINYKRCIEDKDNVIPFNTKDYLVMDKKIYSAYNDELVKFIKDNNIDEIYLCGIDTGACILKTALDLFDNGYNVFVLKDYCSSTRGRIFHNRALSIIKRNVVYNIVK